MGLGGALGKAGAAFSGATSSPGTFVSNQVKNLTGANGATKAVQTLGDPTGVLGTSDVFGNKGRNSAVNAQNAADAQALATKTAADQGAVSDINTKQQAAASSTVDANNKASSAIAAQGNAMATALSNLTTSLGKDDPVALAKSLADQQDKITAAKTQLANDTINQASKLTGLYSQLTTSYSDIAQKYADAVTGLSDTEKSTYRGIAQQDFAAMSAVGQQGANAEVRGSGGPINGNYAMMLTSQAQQGASSAYASAIQNMQNLDTQRRQMQESIVSNSLTAQNQNVQTAGGLMTQQLVTDANARGQQADYMQSGFNNDASMQTNALNTDISKNLDQYGASMGQAQAQIGIAQNQNALAINTINTNLDASTYADTAGINMRAGAYGEQLGAEATSTARSAGAFSQDMAVAGLGFSLGQTAANVMGAKAAQGGGGATPTTAPQQSYVSNNYNYAAPYQPSNFVSKSSQN